MQDDVQPPGSVLGHFGHRSPQAVYAALAKLRSRGGFGLTNLPLDQASRSSRLFSDADDAIDSEVLLPDPTGDEGKMRLTPPGGIEAAAAVKPGKLLEFIQDPPKIDLREAYDPGTSSLNEIDEKRRELQYRKDWLEALLAVTRDEIAAFDEARNQRLLKDRIASEVDASPAQPDGARDRTSENDHGDAHRPER